MIEPAILTAALEGLHLQKARLEQQIAAVQGMIGGRKKPGPKPKALAAADDWEAPAMVKKAKMKRVLSPEARERISAGVKKRWAAARKAKA